MTLSEANQKLLTNFTTMHLLFTKLINPILRQILNTKNTVNQLLNKMFNLSGIFVESWEKHLQILEGKKSYPILRELLQERSQPFTNWNGMKTESSDLSPRNQWGSWQHDFNVIEWKCLVFTQENIKSTKGGLSTLLYLKLKKAKTITK